MTELMVLKVTITFMFALTYFMTSKVMDGELYGRFDLVYIADFNGCPYIFLIYYYITIYVCVPNFYDLSALDGCWSFVSIRRIIYKFLNVCRFDYTAFAVSGKIERS